MSLEPMQAFTCWWFRFRFNFGVPFVRLMDNFDVIYINPRLVCINAARMRRMHGPQLICQAALLRTLISNRFCKRFKFL